MTKPSDIIPGQVLMADAGFTCVESGPVTVYRDDDGLYFHCRGGKHYLDGQCDHEGHLIGLEV